MRTHYYSGFEVRGSERVRGKRFTFGGCQWFTVTTGIHVEIAIGDPTTCQVAKYSEGVGTVTSVTKSPHPDEDALVEEFTVASGSRAVELDGGTTVTDDRTEQMFSAGGAEIFRFERDRPQGCVCERIEQTGCPVREINAVDGSLHVQFIATDHDTLQNILERLTDTYDELRVNRLLRSADAAETQRLVLIDIGALTDRQREVMQTAHERGYFDHPKTASAAQVASELGIATSTFTEHLAAAQRNLLAEVLDR